jgi:hypothetical protein
MILTIGGMPAPRAVGWPRSRRLLSLIASAGAPDTRRQRKGGPHEDQRTKPHDDQPPRGNRECRRLRLLETPGFQRQSRDFAAALTKAGKPVKLIAAKGHNHFEMGESLSNPYGIMGRVSMEMMGLTTAV